MGLSNILREQALTQNQSGQTAPQTPPKVLWPMINAAERLKSDFSIGQLLRHSVPVSRAFGIWQWQLTHIRTSIQLRMQSRFMFDKGFMDLLHTNTVTFVDRDYNDVLKTGRVIVCSPMIDLVAVIDPAENRLVWEWGADDLQGPHNPREFAQKLYSLESLQPTPPPRPPAAS